MARNLFGEDYESLDEYGKRLIKVGYSKPTYRVRINNITYYPNLGIDISLVDLDNNPVKSGSNFGGIYSLWNGLPAKTNCLYVGGSSVRINDRIYRFMKELCNLSREDEDHPAARKCRLSGQDIHNVYVKLLPKHEFPPIKNDFTDMDDDIELFIDEYVAPLLCSNFNKKVKR
jgi:hypothetical protein